MNNVNKKLLAMCLVSLFVFIHPVNACAVNGEEVEDTSKKCGSSQMLNYKYEEEISSEGLYGDLTLPPSINVYPTSSEKIDTIKVYQPDKKTIDGTTLKMAIKHIKKVMQIEEKKLTIIEKSNLNLRNRITEISAIKDELAIAFDSFEKAEYFHTFVNSMMNYVVYGHDDCIEKEEDDDFEGHYINNSNNKIYFSEELKQESYIVYKEYEKILKKCDEILNNYEKVPASKCIKLTDLIKDIQKK